jgi:uncharacterized membrane protein YhhN
MWYALKVTFDVCMALGALLFVGWLALCALFAKVRRTTDRYQRMSPANNYRVGGSINP